MMNKFLRLSSFLLYLLAILCFFFSGAMIAGFAGAGENQGLAGGAIVLMYGVISAGVGFVLALVLIGMLETNRIVLINKILAGVLLVFAAFVAYRIATGSN